MSFVLLVALLVIASPSHGAEQMIRVDTNVGVIIGIVQGDVTFYESVDQKGGLPHIGKVIGNIIINKADSTVALERITKILTKQNLTLESLRTQLKSQFDYYEATVERLSLLQFVPLYAKAMERVQAGELAQADSLLAVGLPTTRDDLEKGYLAWADVKMLRWDRAGAFDVLKQTANMFPGSVDVLGALAELAIRSPDDMAQNVEVESIIHDGIDRARSSSTATPSDRLKLANLIVQLSITQQNQLGVKREQSLQPRLTALKIYENDCNLQLAWCYRQYGRAVTSIGVMYGQSGETESAVKLIEDTRAKFLDASAALRDHPERADDVRQVMAGYVLMSKTLANVYGHAHRYAEAAKAAEYVDSIVADRSERPNQLAKIEVAAIEVPALYLAGRFQDSLRLFTASDKRARDMASGELTPEEAASLLEFYADTAVAWEDIIIGFDPAAPLALLKKQLDAGQTQGAVAPREDEMVNIYCAAFNLLVRKGMFKDAIPYQLPAGKFGTSVVLSNAERALLLQLSGNLAEASKLYRPLLPEIKENTETCDSDCRELVLNNLAWLCQDAAAGCDKEELALVGDVKPLGPLHYTVRPNPRWL